VLAAAYALPRFFPMLMTAAGTIAPARVLVLGAGVAGLTAIGAARRLGAMVPAAKKDPKSPIYGMQVFDVEAARSIIVLKRSMNPGFSGVENELFFLPNTMMVLGDAKRTLLGLTAAAKA
jgi:NAD(P) transhydrogenase subunit beta